MIARIALYSTLGYLLDQGLECHWDSWQFWCIIALFWASEHLSRTETLSYVAEEVERLRAERKDNSND